MARNKRIFCGVCRSEQDSTAVLVNEGTHVRQWDVQCHGCGTKSDYAEVVKQKKPDVRKTFRR